MFWFFIILFGLLALAGGAGLVRAGLRGDCIAGQAGVGEALWVFVCIILLAAGLIGLLATLVIA